MRFDYPGYELDFVQRQRCKDQTAHLYTLIYKFYSPITRYHHIVRAECHEGNFYAIKFYCKKDRRSDYKYAKIINKGDALNILMTCLKVIPAILQDSPTASFGFIGARSMDKASGRFEPYYKTQRYRVYTELAKAKIGQATFEHIRYDAISSYLLINRNDGDLASKEAFIQHMVAQTYNDLLNI